jgi:hypothetical protein
MNKRKRGCCSLPLHAKAEHCPTSAFEPTLAHNQYLFDHFSTYLSVGTLRNLCECSRACRVSSTSKIISRTNWKWSETYAEAWCYPPDRIPLIRRCTLLGRDLWKYNLLPPGITSLVVNYEFLSDAKILTCCLPDTLTELICNSLFCNLVFDSALPSKLERLILAGGFTYSLQLPVFPASLRYLDFGRFFNRPLQKGILPPLLEHLQFGDYYNEAIGIGVLPPSLTALLFGRLFNSAITPGILPPSLTTLRFGLNFNQPLVPGTLPTSLRRLKFGRYFNQALAAGVLPPCLTFLTLGLYYNYERASCVLPSSLRSLYYGMDHRINIAVVALPSSLTSLTFCAAYFSARIARGVLPPSLKYLKLGDAWNHTLCPGLLPASLQTLVFGVNFNQPLSPGSLPASLRRIIFGSLFNQPLETGQLPSHLQCLTLGKMYTHDIDVGVLPHRLRHFTILSISNHSRFGKGVLPKSLETLQVGWLGNLPDTTLLPALKEIHLSCCYHHPLHYYGLTRKQTNKQTTQTGEQGDQQLYPVMIPEGITVLTLGRLFEADLLPGSLPSSLETLIVHPEAMTRFAKGTIRSSVRMLKLGNNVAVHGAGGYLQQLTPRVDINHNVLTSCDDIRMDDFGYRYKTNKNIIGIK